MHLLLGCMVSLAFAASIAGQSATASFKVSVDSSSFPLGTGPKPHELGQGDDYPAAWKDKNHKMLYIDMGHNDIDYENKINKKLSFTFAASIQNQFIIGGRLWSGNPDSRWATAAPAEAGLDEAKLAQAREYALTGGGSGYVVRGGRLVFSWGDPKQRYDLKSTTKSFGAAALGLAIKDGKVQLADKARLHHPSLGTPPGTNADTGWLSEITLLHLASQTAGFDKPGGYVPLLFRPGTEWAYSDSGPNWLAECLTLAYRRDLDELMFERIFTPLGIQRTDLVWRSNAYRPDRLDGLKRREFGAGISANVDAMARFGLLWLRNGEWNGAQILPRDYVDRVRTTVPGVPGLPVRKPEEYGRAANHYGLLWWNNADETIEGLPLDTYWTWGLYDSLIVVMPTLDIVVARAGQSWKRTQGADHYEVLKPFLLPIAGAVRTQSPSARSFAPSAAPYPPSPVIQGIEWAPRDTILRQAKGSENWPVTWADDDHFSVRRGTIRLRE